METDGKISKGTASSMDFSGLALNLVQSSDTPTAATTFTVTAYSHDELHQVLSSTCALFSLSTEDSRMGCRSQLHTRVLQERFMTSKIDPQCAMMFGSVHNEAHTMCNKSQDPNRAMSTKGRTQSLTQPVSCQRRCTYPTAVLVVQLRG